MGNQLSAAAEAVKQLETYLGAKKSHGDWLPALQSVLAVIPYYEEVRVNGDCTLGYHSRPLISRLTLATSLVGVLLILRCWNLSALVSTGQRRHAALLGGMQESEGERLPISAVPHNTGSGRTGQQP
jgi:hypothetical protein